MNLYEINNELQNLVDPETGELLDFEIFEALQMAKTDKLENLALWIKDLRVQSKAFKEEIDNMQNRKRAVDAKADRLEEYLSQFLNGEKFETTKCKVSFRKTSSVKIEDEVSLVDYLTKTGHADCIMQKAPTISKNDLKTLLKTKSIPFAEIVESKSMSIK